MARTVSPMLAKKSPQQAKKAGAIKTSLLRSKFKQPRSPDVFGPDPGRKPGRLITQVRNSPYKRPVLAPKNKLSPVREETPVNEDADSTFDSNFFNDLGPDAFSDGDGEEDSSDLDTDFEGWDDENTLVAKLQDNLVELPEKERLAALADALEGPMQARGELLKQYLAHTIAPAAKKVKEVHNVFEEKVDNVFGISVISFDDACKKIDQMSLRDEDDIKTAYLAYERNVKDLFRQLKDAYSKREELWKDFRSAVDQAEEKCKTSLSSLTSDLEDAVALVEKKTKETSKGGGFDGKAKQKLLRELLADM